MLDGNDASFLSKEYIEISKLTDRLKTLSALNVVGRYRLRQQINEMYRNWEKSSEEKRAQRKNNTEGTSMIIKSQNDIHNMGDCIKRQIELASQANELLQQLCSLQMNVIATFLDNATNENETVSLNEFNELVDMYMAFNKADDMLHNFSEFAAALLLNNKE